MLYSSVRLLLLWKSRALLPNAESLELVLTIITPIQSFLQCCVATHNSAAWVYIYNITMVQSNMTVSTIEWVALSGCMQALLFYVLSAHSSIFLSMKCLLFSPPNLIVIVSIIILFKQLLLLLHLHLLYARHFAWRRIGQRCKSLNPPQLIVTWQSKVEFVPSSDVCQQRQHCAFLTSLWH